MISKLTPLKIKKLQQQESLPSISIYLPMQPGQQNSEANRINYKNAIRTAQHMIHSIAFPTHAQQGSHDWISQAKSLLDQSIFWNSQAQGLTVFINNNSIQSYRVNYSFEPRVYVGTKFIAAPLSVVMPTIEQHYYILALSQKSTRLIEVNGTIPRELNDQKIPKVLKEDLRLDEIDKELQTHPVAPAGEKGSEAFHGHGYYKDSRKLLIDTFMRHVARAVQAVMKKETSPMFVTGTHPIVARYLKVNTYKYAAPLNIYGNVDHLDPEQIMHKLHPYKET